jgi:hypothetical protein
MASCQPLRHVAAIQKVLRGMQPFALGRSLRFAAVILFPIGASAAGAIPQVAARIGDPFQQCEAISKALPLTVELLRQRGKVLSQKVSRDTDEYCDPTKYKCRRVDLRMDGLHIDVLEVERKQGLSPLLISITSGKWRLMKGVHVGQAVSEVGALYGVEIPPNEGKFAVCGEVTCLEVQHRAQRVMRLSLDCQSFL